MQYDRSVITSVAIPCFGRYSEMVLFKSARAVFYMIRSVGPQLNSDCRTIRRYVSKSESKPSVFLSELRGKSAKTVQEQATS